MAKRAFDLVFGAVLALVALPLIVGFAVALAIALRAWPFFTQPRVGLYGRHFRMIKLRTLPTRTPSSASKHELDLSDLPGLCQWLRRSHLDELPQLFSVVAGRMSLVGPRPRMPLEPISPQFEEIRISVLPGCTGLWQIGEHAHLEVSAISDYDLFYVDNASVRMDAWVLGRTFLLVLGIAEPIQLAALEPKASPGVPARPSRERFASLDARPQTKAA